MNSYQRTGDVPSQDPIGNRKGGSPGSSLPCRTTNMANMAAGRSTSAAVDSRPPPGVVSWWPFRAQLPVRTVVAPEGAFSAQTLPARPFSYPAPTFPSAPLPRDPTTGIASVRAQSPPCLTSPEEGCPSAGQLRLSQNGGPGDQCNASASACEGVLKPRVCRGRPLS